MRPHCPSCNSASVIFVHEKGTCQKCRWEGSRMDFMRPTRPWDRGLSPQDLAGRPVEAGKVMPVGLEDDE